MKKCFSLSQNKKLVVIVVRGAFFIVARVDEFFLLTKLWFKRFD